MTDRVDLAITVTMVDGEVELVTVTQIPFPKKRAPRVLIKKKRWPKR